MSLSCKVLLLIYLFNSSTPHELSLRIFVYVNLATLKVCLDWQLPIAAGHLIQLKSFHLDERENYPVYSINMFHKPACED